jgi:hypothetical protein
MVVTAYKTSKMFKYEKKIFLMLFKFFEKLPAIKRHFVISGKIKTE